MQPNCSSLILITLGFIRGYKSSFLLLVSLARVFLLNPPHMFIWIFLFDSLVGGDFSFDVAGVRLVSHHRDLG